MADEQAKGRAAALSVASNAFLIAAKLVAGIATGSVATKVTGNCADTPVADAVMIAGPAVEAAIVTDAVPVPSVVALAVVAVALPLNVPRVVEKVMTWPACGAPAVAHTRVTVWGAVRAMYELAVGTVKAKL